jgi:hypothetical protein
MFLMRKKEKLSTSVSHLIKNPSDSCDYTPLQKLVIESIKSKEIPSGDYFFDLNLLNMSLEGRNASILTFVKQDLPEHLEKLKDSEASKFVTNQPIFCC